MIEQGSRLRQIGWVAALASCCGLFLALSFQVHAVKSEVLLAERQLIALKQEAMMLETEFQARANQRQLANWNAVEFGYQAPRADQYLENERQLARLGASLGVGAPDPIRIARAQFQIDGEQEISPRKMVSPVTGKPVTLAMAGIEPAGAGITETIGELIAQASPVRTANARPMPDAGVAE